MISVRTYNPPTKIRDRLPKGSDDSITDFDRVPGNSGPKLQSGYDYTNLEHVSQHVFSFLIA